MAVSLPPPQRAQWEKPWELQEPRKPVIPFDTPARLWYNKGHTESRELMRVLSFFICQGIPDYELDTFLDSIVPAAGWMSEEEWIGKEPASVSRNNLSYDTNGFRRLIRQYGKRPDKKKR